ncbi:NAD(P)/FAD-dependent oxidoreductase [Hoeflea poritis]|uniref:FAD-dependent oxidoreductase n=1 Tax=Hoeflea poritis TaxID=2993659 RepID=A0ABT4VGG0_9HYPH|nr:FAD-dependent oxidoreductase [Hoeflea poritis]MDA4843786.1 FAD-dependent oxidoreductase [Hoeflea poritis]
MPAHSSYDAIIIGAGVIGACTAFELAKNGMRTLSIDKLPEAGYGSTSGSCAIIRTYYSAFESCAIAYEGWHYWKDWKGYIGVDDEQGLIKYHNTGCLVIKTEHNHRLERVCEMMDRIGCPYEHVGVGDIAQRMPNADTHQFEPAKRPEDEGFGQPTGPSVDGAVFFPNGGYVNDPKLSAHNAQRAAEAHGAEFLFNRAVVEILKTGNRVSGVVLDDGSRIEAPVVVNVAGPHSSKINAMAGVDGTMSISTRALRHEVAHVPAPEGVDFEHQGVVYSDSDIHTYCRPEVGNHILIGSEDPECDEKEWVDDPDSFDGNFSEQWNVLVMRMAQRMPDLRIPGTARGVVALYDVTDDWMPIYDRSDLDGFYMAVGTSGNQYKNAPVAGKMMAALIKSCENGHDHDNDPVRFHLDHVDLDISLGAFSRNREINQDSSFSVIG